MEYEPRPPLLNRPGYGDVLRGAVITASSYEEEQRPEFANDGIHDDAVLRWDTRQLPAWVKFELPEPREIAEVRVWFLAPGLRTHRFFVEGSVDGAAWQMLADRRANTEPTQPGGFTFVLPQPVSVRALRLTVTGNSKSDEGAMIYEVAAFARPSNRALEGAVGDVQRHYDAGNVPLATAERTWRATAWRGERVHGQFVLWTSPERPGLRVEVSALKFVGRGLPTPPMEAGGAGKKLGAKPVGSGDPALQQTSLPATARFVRNVLADGQLVGDVLDDATRVDMRAGSYRAVWLTVESPRDAVPGKYSGTLTARADGAEPLVFPLELEILPATLPAPADWAFHLDLWQHPWAIARAHGVAPWSEEHFRVMRPYLTELANAGQKVITTTITDRPWGKRDFDDYGAMVTHVREADGSWRFDYTVFDRYVEFAMGCGITRQINCYSLLTWSGRLYWTDAATGDQRSSSCDPAAGEFAEYWGPFLRDFEKHLAAKGWLARTRLAVDEAPAPMMKAMTELVRTHAPRLQLSLAGNQVPSHYTGLDLREFSIILDHASDELLRDIAARRADGRVTTFYVCLDPKRPNTFVASPPAEATWLGYYAAANGFDGFLRWAWTTWPAEPLRDTSYWGHPYLRYLPAGDTFLIYSGPRSSVRWEMLRDGFEEWEKLRLLRARSSTGELPVVVATQLEKFRDPKKLGDDAALLRDVEAMRAAINTAAADNLR